MDGASLSVSQQTVRGDPAPAVQVDLALPARRGDSAHYQHWPEAATTFFLQQAQWQGHDRMWSQPHQLVALTGDHFHRHLLDHRHHRQGYTAWSKD